MPNPIRSADTAEFKAEGMSIEKIKVEIYELARRKVFDSGWRLGSTFEWQLWNNGDEMLANGIYLCLVRVKGPDGEERRSEVKKLAILR